MFAFFNVWYMFFGVLPMCPMHVQTVWLPHGKGAWNGSLWPPTNLRSLDMGIISWTSKKDGLIMFNSRKGWFNFFGFVDTAMKWPPMRFMANSYRWYSLVFPFKTTFFHGLGQFPQVGAMFLHWIKTRPELRWDHNPQPIHMTQSILMA